tara:strand:- start:176 stop:640 length:465 start_codon:yes stop_codon:yes gene_type:complete
MARLTPEQLEQKIHALLQDHPPRRAPLSLEARVLGEIARRQALPWWHKSFAYWPNPVRIAFMVLATGLVAMAVLGSMQLAGVVSWQTVSGLFRPIVDAVATVKSAGTAIGSITKNMLPGISSQWLYVALGVIGAAYAMMFGIGATAYRVFWQRR